jgi:hypothetical protein
MYGAVGRDTGYSEAGSLLWTHILRQWSHVIQRHDCKLRRGTERAIGLRRVAPYFPAKPVRGHAFANLIHTPGAVAVRNDPWIRHAKAEGVLALLDITWVYAGSLDPNADFTRSGMRVGYLANHEYIPRRTLLLIPGCPHLKNLVSLERSSKCMRPLDTQPFIQYT